MKKLISIIVALVIGFSTIAYAQSKAYLKEIEKYEKEAKRKAQKMAKALKKGKWETTGVVDLETVLTNYYLQTEPTCGGTKRGVEHTINDAKKLNIAEKRLLIDAQVMYAQEMRTMLAQTIVGRDPLIDENDADAIVSEITAKSEKEFNGDLERAFLIYRTNPDGQTITVRAFYIIDQENGLSRLERMANSVKKTSEIQNEILNH